MPRFYTNSPLPVGAALGAEPQCYSPGAPPPGLRVCPTASSTKAFSLVEIVAVLAIIGILGGTVVPLAFQLFTSKRGEVTVDRLEEFKKALIGNPFVIGDDVRSSFGYIGDMGNLPTSLQDLYIRGAQPTYNYNSTLKTGAGWRGPYINPDIIEDLATLRLDAYKQQLVYSTTAFTDIQTGASIVGALTSTGPNRTQGGMVADDRKVYVFKSEAFATVSGFLKDTGGNRLPNIRVTMNYPANGSLATLLSTTDSTGYFSFSDIPFGNRSVSVEAKLVYSPDSAVAADLYGRWKGPHNYDPDNDGILDDIILYITNVFPDPITVRSVRIYFDFGGKGNDRFDQVFIYGPTYSEGAKEGSGQSGVRIRFDDAIVIGGGGGGSAAGQSYPIRVQSPRTHISDLNIRNYPAGETVRMAIASFGRPPNTKPLNVRGLPLKIEFYSDTGATLANRVSTIVINDVK